jgi:hypothetical protein
MMRRMLILCEVLFVVLPASALSAPRVADSTDTSSGKSATLLVTSPGPSVRIYVDSTYVGTTPLDSVQVPPGRHILHALGSDTAAWLPSTWAETLDCRPAERIVRTVKADRYDYVETEPYGASVTVQGKVLGETPVWIPAAAETSFCVFSKAGYNTARASVVSDTILRLEAMGGSPATTAVPGLVTSAKNDLPLYLTAGAAVVFGAVSAYFKIKADHMNADYQVSGDPASLSHIHHYDALAGASLVLCQVNLAGLAYLLFSR